MPKRGNKRHWPAGIPIGGQFAPKNMVGIVRSEPMQGDIKSHTNDLKDIEKINRALYDGGYITECDDTLHGFKSAKDAERFIKKITTTYEEKETWRKHKNLVKNHVEVVKGYLQQNKFDLVGDGKYSANHSDRITTELLTELGWGKEEVRQTLMNALTAESFVSSGRNASRYRCNQGTVVMVYSPRIETKQTYIDSKTGRKMIRRHAIDLYVKIAINPHPGNNADGSPQSEMQILSFREAGEPNRNSKDFGGNTKAKTLLYTGEEHKSRLEWQLPKNKNHKDRPLTLLEQREKKHGGKV